MCKHLEKMNNDSTKAPRSGAAPWRTARPIWGGRAVGICRLACCSVLRQGEVRGSDFPLLPCVWVRPHSREAQVCPPSLWPPPSSTASRVWAEERSPSRAHGPPILPTPLATSPCLPPPLPPFLLVHAHQRQISVSTLRAQLSPLLQVSQQPREGGAFYGPRSR